MSEQVVRAYFPEKLAPLFEPHRYKVCVGGRGGGKSWSIARALLIEGTQEPLRILCTREFQSSISDSVHKLLSDQVSDLGLEKFYDIEKSTIRGKNGTEFRFAGIKTNVTAIKSFEAVDRCWVEEAANVSNHSWQVLIPTIRKENSEIWISFNPELEADATYQRFVTNPPPNSVVIKINYDDNDYFPEVLQQEMEYLKQTDQDAYENIWLGMPRSTLVGAVYSKELKLAEAENRITTVNYDPIAPVHTFWDLGWNDQSTIWFAQVIGMEYRVIDYLEDHQRPITDYIKELQSKPYVYGTDFLPHDAKAHQLGTGRSIEEIMRSLGREVVVVPRLSVEDGINAARTVFGKCWFDRDKTRDGRQALAHYRYDEKTNKPVHDYSSHAADSFRYLAIMLGRPQGKVIKLERKFNANITRDSWMAR